MSSEKPGSVASSSSPSSLVPNTYARKRGSSTGTPIQLGTNLSRVVSDHFRFKEPSDSQTEEAERRPSNTLQDIVQESRFPDGSLADYVPPPRRESKYAKLNRKSCEIDNPLLGLRRSVTDPTPVIKLADSVYIGFGDRQKQRYVALNNRNALWSNSNVLDTILIQRKKKFMWQKSSPIWSSIHGSWFGVAVCVCHLFLHFSSYNLGLIKSWNLLNGELPTIYFCVVYF